MNVPNNVFIDETTEILEQFELDLIKLEKNPGDDELINRIFRGVHTIKGSAGMFGFSNLSEQAHVMENVFDQIREKTLEPSRKIIDLGLQGVDFLRRMLQDSTIPADTAEWEAIIPQGTGTDSRSATEAQMKVEDAAQEGDFAMYHIFFRPDMNFLMTGGRPDLLFRELSELGEIRITADVSQLPGNMNLDPGVCYTRFDILLAGETTEEQIRDVFIFAEHNAELSVRRISINEDDESTLPKLGEILLNRKHLSRYQMELILEEQKKYLRLGEIAVQRGFVNKELVDEALNEQDFIKEQFSKRHDSQASLRIPGKKVDTAVNLVGELVTLQARLSRRMKTLKDQQLTGIVEALELLVGDLRQGVMSMRLVPLNDTFISFKRLVRDLSRETGKEIELSISGGETELDKIVIDRLKGAFVHLIRNSADHGLETREERLAANKPATGTIYLQARYIGSQVEIEISDDGAGVNNQKVWEKAVSRGLISADSNPDEIDVLSLLTAPGFSTSDEVSSVSGRGVGMDAVLMEVEALSGTLSMDSRKGQGSSFRIRLPLTLAIIDSLLVRVGKDHFTIHLSDVDECFILRDAPEVLRNRKCLKNYNGAAMAYVDLRQHLKIEGETPQISNVVVSAAGGQPVGIVVDEIIGQYQAVIKPLNTALRTAPELSGTTILGDGGISFILDIAKLVSGIGAEQRVDRAALSTTRN
ncbi:chemotaxis protein CheA [Spirochaeta dissipatitropha]